MGAEAMNELKRLAEWQSVTTPPAESGEYMTWAERWQYGRKRVSEHMIMGYDAGLDVWSNPDDWASDYASYVVLEWQPLPVEPGADQPLLSLIVHAERQQAAIVEAQRWLVEGMDSGAPLAGIANALRVLAQVDTQEVAG